MYNNISVYFGIILVATKSDTSIIEVFDCLKEFELFEGKHVSKYFGGKEILVSWSQNTEEDENYDDEYDFDEIWIDIPELIFHK